jgi:hypothetical protein
MIVPITETLSNASATLSFEPSTCNDLHECRTLWNIVWSSLITVFACIWLSVHPNIPAPDDSWGRKAVRRVFTMVLALLAPELVVGWAMRQRMQASNITKENKSRIYHIWTRLIINLSLQEYNWTKTHGFFAIMGGFMEHHDDGPPTVLEAKDVPAVTKKRILEAEIQDRSKGDGLSKTFALVQTTWFILQCISRAIENLPVTELEVATCAFAVLNFATYILWWNKPLNVSRPVLVYRDQQKEQGEVETNEGTAPGSEEEMAIEEGVKEGCGQSVKRMWKVFVRGLVDIPKEIYRPIDASIEEWELGLPFGLIDPILAGSSFASDQRVGTFGPEPDDNDVTLWSLLTSAAVGIIFGSIHCTAWRFQFPSYIEQVLWRISAISVTGGPLLMGLILGLAGNADSLDTLSSIAIVLVLILYIIARLALLVLSFMTLRSLPPGAFRAADWARFIPHFA